MAKYIPVRGSSLTVEQAAKYGTRITELIEEKQRSVVVQEVLDDARNEESPLHDYFDWDNKVAAHKWRLEQARYLLRSISVVVKREDGSERAVRAFLSVALDDGYELSAKKMFVSVERVLSEEVLRKQVIDEALRQLIIWRKKYDQYSEFAKVIIAIEEVESKLI